MKKRNRMSKLYWLIPLIVAVLWFAVGAKAGIYNNSGTTSEDSICFAGVMMDSGGYNCVPIVAANDSLYVLVFYPGGALAFRDSMLMNDAQITIAAFEDQASASAFTYKCAVADVDGGGQNGVYKVVYFIRDVSLATTFVGKAEAQVYATANLSTWADALKYDSDSLVFGATLDNPSFLSPTTASRTLDVTATGEAGIDLDNTAGTLAKTTDITGFNDIAAVDPWNVSFGTAFTAGSMGDSLNGMQYSKVSQLIVANVDAAISTRGTSNFAAATDSVIVDRSSLSLARGNFDSTYWNGVQDSVWQADSASYATGATMGRASSLTGSAAGGITEAQMWAMLDTAFVNAFRDALGDSLLTFAAADSIFNAITDANKANFGRWSAAQLDSVLQALDYTNNTRPVARATQATVINVNGSGYVTYANTAPPTAAQNADAVWDEVIGGAHEAAGSAGELLIDGSTASTLMYTNGVKLLATGLDADTSFTNLQTRLAAVRDSVNAILDTLQNHDADWGAGSGFSAADRDSMRDIVGDTSRAYDATGGAAADIYPFNGIKLTIDAAGADPDAQFVVDTASLGGLSSHQATLVNRQLVVRSLSGIEVQIPTTINRVAYTGANCSLSVNMNMPIDFAAGDTIQLAGWPWHDFATVSEASDSNAQALLLTDLTGNPQDSLVRGFIKSGGVAGSDTTAQKAMLTGMGVPRGLDSLASLSETATADGTLRRGEIVTARAAAETTSVVLAADSIRYPLGGVIDTARNASGISSSCTGDGAIAFDLYFVDTLGTDETVGDGHISLYTNSSCTGTPAYWGKTGALGYIPFSVDTGTYWACASKIASVNATSAQYFHVTASSSDSVLGYGFATSTRAVIDGIVQLPGGPDTVCAYCDVVFEMVTAGGNVRDTVLNTVVIPQAVTGYTLATGVPVQASGAPFELRKTQNLVSTVGQTKYAVKWVMKVTLNDGSIWQSNQFSISNDTDVVDIGEI